MRAALLAVLLVAMPASLATLAPPAAANPLYGQVVAHLAIPRNAASAVWDGHYAYVFGGIDSAHEHFLDEIVRFDPATGQVKTMGAHLPTARSFTSAVWTGQAAFVFGGSYGSTIVDDVVRYDPARDRVDVMGAHILAHRDKTSAVWDGSRAYVIGTGLTATHIQAYDPGNDSMTTLLTVLPGTRIGTSAVWDGVGVDIFAGEDALGVPLDTALRFDPVSGLVVPISFLPSPRDNAPAVWTGSAAYLFGGYVVPNSLDEVVRMDVTACPTGLVQDPANGGWLRGLITAQGQAAPAVTASTTRLLLDDDLKASGDGSGVSWPWDTQLGVDGLHILDLKLGGILGCVIDLLLNLRVDNTPPVAKLLDPAPGSVTVGALGQQLHLPSVGPTVAIGDTRVRADASDATSGVAAVNYYVDGALRGTRTVDPWVWTWPAGSEGLGMHHLAVQAVDAAGNESPLEERDVLTVPTGVAGLVATLLG